MTNDCQKSVTLFVFLLIFEGRIRKGQPISPSPPPKQPFTDAPEAELSPGLVWAFRFDRDGAAEECSQFAYPAETFDAGDDEGWSWLHFNLSDARVCDFLREKADTLPPEALELLTSSGGHQQLHVYEDCIYGVFADLVYRLDGLTDEMGLLHFAAKGNILLTGRREGLNSLEIVRQKLRSGRVAKSPAALLEMILEKVARGVELRAEDLANEVDTIEERLIVEVSDNHPKELARVRRLTVRLHRLLSTQRSMIARFDQRSRRDANTVLALRSSDLAQRLDWLDHEIIALRDRAHLLQEEVSMRMTDQTNKNLQLLTIVTTVLLPASVIASIFGMNVGGLPLEQDGNGFIWSMILLVGASVLVFQILKRLGLFRR